MAANRPKRQPGPAAKVPKKPSLLKRLLRKLESRRQAEKREDPTIYPLF